ncbi:TetR/AcrR family transcriptional regulator [Vulgatibacter incomptus]|uniref:Transcriptional regulator, TetR family n=1 Tax=Vulgatibacter incomptus TaxID=1391653 RepID=A0A0K1PE78_9BACT|nr:TetR/AcrR family transcriptional regulator [Vulgatibacter incomptus]AKU91802.1 Transcriptional regulator, TetR family [Vulgatibacter incomptus]
MAKQDRTRPYHHGDLKRALVEASLELLREQGLDTLTVAEVGRRVGVSSAAPYKHFADRHALLRAVAAEGNRLLNAAILETVGSAADPVEAFRLSGVAYIRWAAQNPALYRLATDPALLDYGGAPPPDAKAPEALQGSLDTFWSQLAELVRSGRAIPAGHPLIEQLRGRALAHGVASLFVSGVFDSIGIPMDEAERIARAVTGEFVPARREPRKA